MKIKSGSIFVDVLVFQLSYIFSKWSTEALIKTNVTESNDVIPNNTFTKHALKQVLITILAFNPWVPDVEFVLLSCAKEVASWCVKTLSR